MKIACCIWALSGIETEVLRQVRDLGFDRIDIQPAHLQALESRLLAQELGLEVSCVGASFGMPDGAGLDQADAGARRAAVDHVRDAIERAAHLGAGTIYVVPGADGTPAGLERYAESLARLAAVAEEAEIKLAVEHFPATALPTAGETLAFLEEINHPNLYLLYDSGHIQISGEDAVAVIEKAGARLGYVHLDDNDGISDLHWSLLDGVMTEESLADTIAALDGIGFQGALSLELNPKLRQIKRALQSSRDILLRACLL